MTKRGRPVGGNGEMIVGHGPICFCFACEHTRLLVKTIHHEDECDCVDCIKRRANVERIKAETKR